MGRLIETVGKYAERPYYIAQTDTSVYCVEELCFVLSQNTFLLDRGLLDRDLAKWLDDECGLKDLARPLYTLIGRNGSPSAFVGMILEYAHFGTEKKRQETEELLRVNADMDASTRRKHFADYLVENKRYVQAVAEYEKVLEEMPAAYQENPDHEEAAFAYLAALRMRCSEEEYIAFIADHPMWHEQSLEVESRMEKSRKEYEESDACRELGEQLSRHDAEYYEKVSERLSGMRRKYREMAAQS